MIVLNGKLDRILRLTEFTIVSFTIPNYQSNYLKELTDELYSIEIKKPKSRKTLAQNNYAWQLMTEIARELAIYPSPDDVYEQVVKMAKIKTVFLESLNDEKVIDGLRKTFRIVEVKEERLSVKGKETVMLECYWGMSNFDKEEMQRFIDVLLNYASEVGIDVSGYER